MLGAVGLLSLLPGSVAPRPARGAALPPAGFVYASGNRLLLNGAAYRFKGLNVYRANNRGESCGDNGSMELGTSLDTIGRSANAMRAWFFQDMVTTNGVRSWTPFDQTLTSLSRKGVKVIATFTDYWGACQDVPANKDYAWFTDGYKRNIFPGTTQTYRDFVHDTVARYAHNPTILAWQLINEGQVAGCPSESEGAQALRRFADDMGGVIKSIDPNHLISLGTGIQGGCGFQVSDTPTRNDYYYVHASPPIGLCEYHDYDQVAAPLPVQEQQEMESCKALNKPFFVGEIGIPESDRSRPAELTAKLDEQFGYSNEPARGILVWQWGVSVCDSFCVRIGDPVLSVLKNY
jgi:mannan endo-1,4-beta-mannosidase